MSVLNKSVRAQIADAVLAHGFAADLKALATSTEELKREVYEAVYDAHTRGLMATLEDIAQKDEKHAFRAVDKLWVNVAGMRVFVGLPGANSSQPYLNHLIAPHKSTVRYRIWESHENGTILVLQQGTDLGMRIMDHDTAKSDMEVRLKTRHAEVTAILEQARNEGQLRSIWPEVMPIASQFIKTPVKSQVPMILTAELNASLGLPPETTEERELEAS